LDVPIRRRKPRTAGLTHVLDKGASLRTATELLDAAGDYIDIWKFGWGTAYVDPTVGPKLQELARRDVVSCLGGTLLEIAWAQGRSDECLAWAKEVGFAAVEVSRGVAAMSVAEKHELVRRATGDFLVLSEVGRKDAEEDLAEEEWTGEVTGDLEAGARWVIAEGRESGSVGLYHPDGSVRANIVGAVAAAAGPEAVLFEAPRKDQQAWFIHEFGPEVNLANVALDDVIPLETLRLGLRADPFSLSQQWLRI
jgi:phosphosulfolactate synthase